MFKFWNLKDTKMYPNVTDKFWKYILIPKEVIETKLNVSYSTNAVIFKSIVIFGYQGEGKTVTANAIAGRMYKYYGKENVFATMTEDGNLESILRLGFKNRLVNVLFVDNLTLRKIDTNTLANYFMCRHIYSKVTRRNTGYIFSMLGIHRFFSCPTELRTNIDGIIIRNTSLNPYDKNFLLRMTGENNYQKILELEANRLYDRRLYNWSYFVSKHFSGFIYIEPDRHKNFWII